MNPKIQALVAAARAKHEALVAERRAKEIAAVAAIDDESAPEAPPASPVNLTLLNTSTFAIPDGRMVFNPDQLQAIELGLQAKSFCLIGAAGTGKTTVTQALIAKLQQAAHMRPLSASTKHLDEGAPSIVICGFTNKAVNNIRKKLPPQLQKHCITIHKLIEYQPNYYDIITDDGQAKTTMRFEPARNMFNKLPHISTIIFEESSMIGIDLYGEVIAALPNPAATQLIFLGDLNQIPPVFGPSILGFKLVELRTVELTHVYRQALASPIISIATAVRTDTLSDLDWLPKLSTETIKQDNGEHGHVTIHPWKKRISKEHALEVMKGFIPRVINSGDYNPDEDMILCPFNKSFGTIELNKGIADFLGKRRGATIFEVIARYQRSYWAVGDRVLVDRHEAIIKKIEPTIGYSGKLPVQESKTLDRWGLDPENQETQVRMTAEQALNELDRLATGDDNEAKNLASHQITVHIPDLGIDKVLGTAGEINSMLFGYCLTVHKSQGSEWENVFLFLHDSHAIMLSRELIYTAVTRAKHKLYVICENDAGGRLNSLMKAAQRPIIPGTTLKEKIAYFAEKAKSMKATESDEQD